MNARDRHSSLWAVTTFFNPAGYRSRLRNFRVFREHLQAPLLAVELSFDGRFELQTDDAEMLVQWQVGDPMWQKERLLNSAWARLPPHCTEVAWLDCDIVLTNPDWMAEARSGLRRWKAMHGFTTLRHLPPDVGTGEIRSALGRETSVLVSVVQLLRQHGDLDRVFSGVLTRADGAPTPGIAWVARREWISAVRLFDGCIVGGGDTAWAAAVLGQPERAVALHAMGERQRDYYLRWASTPGLTLGNDVGCLEGDALHLWHGSLADRHSRERHQRLAETRFDPCLHLVAADDEPWRWSDRECATARYVRGYFDLRREDGTG